MAFAPTPARSNAPSQLLSLASILAATGGESGNSASGGSITLTDPPTMGIANTALSFGGTVSPSGTTLQAGLSSSSNVAPTSWTSATVSGEAWTASLTPSASGTFYIWVEQTATPAVRVISAAITVVTAISESVAFTSPPSTGTAGTALSLAGTVSPAGTEVRVGISSSSSNAPTSWTNASVSGTGWTASLTPSSAGTFYLWAEQTNLPSVQVVSAAITIGSAGGSGGTALAYSLISGSGNGSLTSTTLSTATIENYEPSPAVDWTSLIAPGAADVSPCVVASSGVSSSNACKFWFDSSATNTTVPGAYGNAASCSNGAITFYANNTGYGTPTSCPAAPSSAGTYYGKYAIYDSNSTLLGVFATSAITIT